jgi:electron transfer flavoprotein beta subunit
MNFIVLIKGVPSISADTKIEEIASLRRSINLYDKHAIQAALELKEAFGGYIKVLSVGPEWGKRILGRALAMGADEAYLIKNEDVEKLDASATSHILAEAIKKIGSYDLILCGIESTDRMDGQVGPWVAERLGIPQLTYVEGIELSGDLIKAKRIREGGYEWVECRYPALLSITSTAFKPKGYVSARRRREAIKRVKSLDVDQSKAKNLTEIVEIEKVREERGKCKFIDMESLDELVEELMRRV